MKTDDTAVAAPPRIDGSLLAALAGNFLIRLDSGMVGMLVTLYLASIDQRGIVVVSATTVGILSSVFYIVELFGSPIMGAKCDEHGNRTLLLIGPFVGMAAALVASITVVREVFNLDLGAVAGISMLLVALGVTRLLQGLAAATSIPSILSFLSERTEGSLKLRGRVMSIFEVTTAVGLLVGPIVGAQLWQFVGPWGFTITAVLFLTSAAAFWLVRDKPSGERAVMETVEREPFLTRFGRLLQRRDLMIFVPAWLAINAVVGLWGVHLIYQMRNGDLDDTQFLTNYFDANTLSVILGGFGLVFGVGIMAWGFAFGRMREITVMRLSLIGLFGVCMATFAINHSEGQPLPIAIGIVGVAMSLGVQSGFAPAAVTYLARLTGKSSEDRGLLMGIYSVVLGLGQFTGHLLGGPFADAGGVDGIILLTLVLGFIATITIIRLTPAPESDAGHVGEARLSLHA